MSIGSVSGMGINPYAYMDSSRETAKAGNFSEEVQRAAEEKGTAKKTSSSLWEGDMVIPQPPSYSGFTYDNSISGKSREEMTMDEYKQWFMNEMSQMPVSAWVRSTIVGGALTITEECFERMKSDPEWENTVLGMVRKMYSVNGIMGTKAIGYQVIGASPEQCYGAGIPVKDSSTLSTGNEKSWWEKRHEKLEELMEEQGKEALKRAQARRALAQESYLKSRLASQRFIADSMQNGPDGIDPVAIPNAGIYALAATAYEKNISTISKSVIN